MRYYPIHLDLKDRRALVVGGGAIAEGKAIQLVDAGAQVKIVSPTLTATLSELAEKGIVEHREGEFSDEDLNGVFLAISATDDQSVNQAVARAAERRGLLCNVVDQPALCNFITPALVTRGGLQISVSTAGGSPSVAKRVKREIAQLIGDEYAELLEVAAEMRAEVKKVIPDFEGRKKVLHAFAESQALDLIREGKRDEAAALARKFLHDALLERENG